MGLVTWATTKTAVQPSSQALCFPATDSVGTLLDPLDRLLRQRAADESEVIDRGTLPLRRKNSQLARARGNSLGKLRRDASG